MIGINLPKHKKMSLQEDILAFTKPNYVYIPLVNHTNLNCEALVKKGDIIYKGSIVGQRNDHFKIPLHSSISGKVIGIEKRPYLNGQLVKCIKIENDFKEKIEPKKIGDFDLSSYTKKEFISILQDYGIVGMGGSGFPTYIKYDTKLPLHTLIVNGVECEPFITADHMLMLKKAEEILECIDAIMEIMGLTKGYIAIKKGNLDLKNELEKYIGTYPNIKLVTVKALYPYGWEKNLIKLVLGIDYQQLPSEKGIIVNNVATIYSIYEALKYHKPVIEKMITVTGANVAKPHNIIVKIGTSVADILAYLEDITIDQTTKLIAGGPMMGVSLSSDDLIVSNNLNSIIIMPNFNKDPYIECMRCGKCVSICPVKLAPVLIKNNLANKEELHKLNPDKCIECGLCSYICPSKVDVREYVKQAKLK